MADLNVRNIPEELLRQIKVQAAEEGVTLREFVLAEMSKAARYTMEAHLKSDPKLAQMYSEKAKKALLAQLPVRAQRSDPLDTSGNPTFKDVGHGGICMCRECEAKRR